ncbi:MAG: type I-E CRISPR-associated endonuclease Cas1 [Deltaproteobacteria bacterium]|nr:type I-E CRISPR-associated endonuclease Cas1 [Deltaproteobacteria bacterium]
MRIQDLHVLPKFRDGWTYLYVEHCKVEQEEKSIAVIDAKGKTAVPCATLCLLLIGPGTSITHAAVSALADNGCLVCWCGEEGVRFYAYGQGKTRHAHNMLRQAQLWASTDLRLQVVRKMYAMRFDEPLDDSLTLRQIRGMEGVRVRQAYSQASRETGVPWQGRFYDPSDWSRADPVNRALSAANSCLYGICQAGILALGLSPALGFIHTGKMLSFVYDIADLYKTQVSIPIAFRMVSESLDNIESRVRRGVRDMLRETKLLKTIVADVQSVLDLQRRSRIRPEEIDFDSDPALPGNLWNPSGDDEAGGRNFSEEPSTGDEDDHADP